MIRKSLVVLLVSFAWQASYGAEPDLGLEPPALNTNPGPEYADEVRTGNMIIGIDRTPK